MSFNRSERAKLDRLDRRRFFLAARVATRPETDMARSHDAAELAALEWATRTLRAADEAGLLEPLARTFPTEGESA